MSKDLNNLRKSKAKGYFKRELRNFDLFEVHHTFNCLGDHQTDLYNEVVEICILLDLVHYGWGQWDPDEETR